MDTRIDKTTKTILFYLNNISTWKKKILIIGLKIFLSVWTN